MFTVKKKNQVDAINLSPKVAIADRVLFDPASWWAISISWCVYTSRSQSELEQPCCPDLSCLWLFNEVQTSGLYHQPLMFIISSRVCHLAKQIELEPLWLYQQQTCSEF